MKYNNMTDTTISSYEETDFIIANTVYIYID